MAIVVRLHRLLVLRIVVGTGALVTVEDFDHVGRKGIAAHELLGRPLIRACERRAEGEADDPLRAGEHVLEREHAAPGCAEEMDPVEAQLRAHRVDLFTEDVHRPLDVLRSVRAATADLVVDDDRPLRRESLERTEVVMGGARAAVQGEERRGPGPELAGNAVPGAVAAKVGVALGNTRLHAGLRYGPSALLAQLRPFLTPRPRRRSPRRGTQVFPRSGFLRETTAFEKEFDTR